MVFLLLTLPAALARAQQYDLAVTVPVQGVTNQSHGRRILTDAAGNVYIAGHLSGTLAIGLTPLFGGPGSVFVAKMAPTGVWLWATVTKGDNNDTVHDFAMDAGGNLYLTGNFLSRTIQFGTTTLTNANTNPNLAHYDIYVAKLDPTGQWVWATRGGSEEDERVGGLALTSIGSIYLTGIYSRPGTQLGNTRLAVGPEALDLFVAMLTPQGQWQWAVRGGHAAGSIDAIDIDVDGQDNAYVGGSFSESVQFGSYTVRNVGASNVPTDVYIAKIGPTGQWLAATGAGGSYSEYVMAMDVDRAGNVYLTGGLQSSSAMFGPITLTAPGGPNEADVFVAKLGRNGQWQWAVAGGGTRLDEPFGVTADRYGNCYVTGKYYSQPPAFGPFTLPPANFQPNIFTAKVSLLGQWDWAIAAGGLGEDIGFGVAYANQRVYTCGSYQGVYQNTLMFGPFMLPSASSYSGGWVARLISPEVRILGDTLQCAATPVTLAAAATETVSAYRWSTGATTPTISVTRPGTYFVTATFAGGQTSTALHELTGFSPTARITGDSLLCPGGTVVLTAVASPGATYRWSTGATGSSLAVGQPGTYSLTATYGSGCVVTAQFVVQSRKARITGSAELCSAASTTTLTAEAPGATGISWSTGATTPTLTVSRPGTYTLTATFPGGCVVTSSRAVTVPTLQITGDSLLCAGTPGSLLADAPGATGFIWSTGATTAAIQPTQSGQYSVQARFAGGCIRTATVQVRARASLPTFSLGPDTTLCVPQSMVLRVPVALQQPGNRYLWSTGDRTPTLTVAATGTYSVEVSSACETRQASRTINTTFCLIIPNIITPNGDQRNDYFVIEGLSGTEWQLEVFTRWGTRVYATAAYRNDWGPGAAPGTYFYTLRHTPTGRVYKGWLQVAP